MENSTDRNWLNIHKDYHLRFDFESRDSVQHIFHWACLSKISHSRCAKNACTEHTHTPPTTASQRPLHRGFNTVTTEHAPKPSSFYSPQPINCQKDAQAAVEVGLTSGTHGYSRELPVSPRDSEEVVRSLPKKPQTVSLLPTLILPYWNLSLETINLFWGFQQALLLSSN